jgi:hypothetical protein
MTPIPITRAQLTTSGLFRCSLPGCADRTRVWATPAFDSNPAGLVDMPVPALTSITTDGASLYLAFRSPEESSITGEPPRTLRCRDFRTPAEQDAPTHECSATEIPTVSVLRCDRNGCEPATSTELKNPRLLTVNRTSLYWIDRAPVTPGAPPPPASLWSVAK